MAHVKHMSQGHSWSVDLEHKFTCFDSYVLCFINLQNYTNFTQDFKKYFKKVTRPEFLCAVGGNVDYNYI